MLDPRHVERAEDGMGVDYVCQWCGYAGHARSTNDADEVQCSQCGELVVPLPRGSGIVDGIDDF